MLLRRGGRINDKVFTADVLFDLDLETSPPTPTATKVDSPKPPMRPIGASTWDSAPILAGVADIGCDGCKKNNMWTVPAAGHLTAVSMVTVINLHWLIEWLMDRWCVGTTTNWFSSGKIRVWNEPTHLLAWLQKLKKNTVEVVEPSWIEETDYWIQEMNRGLIHPPLSYKVDFVPLCTTSLDFLLCFCHNFHCC